MILNGTRQVIQVVEGVAEVNPFAKARSYPLLTLLWYLTFPRYLGVSGSFQGDLTLNSIHLVQSYISALISSRC